MLGTNDLLSGAEPEDTAAHLKSFLEKLKCLKPDCPLLVAAPPPVDIAGEDFSGAIEALAEVYCSMAHDIGAFFADTTVWQIPTVGDGIHFSQRGHMLFALKMGRTLYSLANSIGL